MDAVRVWLAYLTRRAIHQMGVPRCPNTKELAPQRRQFPSPARARCCSVGGLLLRMLRTHNHAGLNQAKEIAA